MHPHTEHWNHPTNCFHPALVSKCIMNTRMRICACTRLLHERHNKKLDQPNRLNPNGMRQTKDDKRSNETEIIIIKRASYISKLNDTQTHKSSRCVRFFLHTSHSNCKDRKHSAAGGCRVMLCTLVALHPEKSSKVRHGQFNRQSAGWRGLKRLFTSALLRILANCACYSQHFLSEILWAINGAFENSCNPLSFDLYSSFVFWRNISHFIHIFIFMISFQRENCLIIWNN